MRSGFVLVEVLIASFIAAMIGAALFAAFYQTNKSTQQLDTVIDIHDKIIVATQQLERDFAGAFIPAQPPQKKDAKVQGHDNPADKAVPAASQEDGSKKQPKKITHIFYGVNKDGQLDTLTFITNNPLQTYWSERAGKAQPRVARVVYRIVQSPVRKKNDNKEKPSYELVRQEGYTLDFDVYKVGEESSIRGYTVIDGIKKLDIKYSAEIPKKSDGDASDTQRSAQPADKDKKKPETQYETFDDWDIEEQKKDAKKMRPPIPNDIELTLTLWDSLKRRELTTTMKITRVTTGQVVEHQGQASPLPV